MWHRTNRNHKGDLSRDRLHPGDIDKARKRIFVREIAGGAKLMQAALKSGLTPNEARTFRRTDEYINMMNYFWTKFLQREFRKGSQKLFTGLVTALTELSSLVQSGNPEIKLRAISEIRQWLCDQKNPVLQRLTTQILESGETNEDEETLSEPSARAAKKLLNRIRKERRLNGGNGTFSH